MISARSKARSARSERDETSNRHGRTLASPDAVGRAGDRAKATRNLCEARDVSLADQHPPLKCERDCVASASGWHDFRCPAHDDKTASCGIKDDRGGKIAIKCHAGCERDAILDAIEAKGRSVATSHSVGSRATFPPMESENS
jgi:hypothetical protein